MKMICKLKIIAVALIVAAAGFIPAAAFGNGSKQNIEGIIEYNLQKSSAASVQEWIDGELTRDAGTGSEWYIIALSNHGNYDFSGYKNALNAYLSENEVGSASSRLKFALTYIAIGDRTNPYISKILGNSIGEQGIMSLVFGLHLLNNGCICDTYTVDTLIDELLALQLSDGGFSVTGEYGDVDVTAMTVQALAVHYNDNPDVKSSVNSALDFISARQLESGGYSGYGITNPESSAQVVTALSSLGIDVCSDSRFIKNGNTVFDGMNAFRLDDGSFCHKEGDVSDSMATAQVFGASIAYENMKNGKSSFYIFENSKKIVQETTTQKSASETITNALTTEAASAQTTLTETTFYVENGSETTTTESASYTQKTEPAEADETETKSAYLIIILVCAVSALICVVLFASKKHKYIVIVIIAAIVIIVLTHALTNTNNTHSIGSVSISIRCDVIKAADKNHIPKNGIILNKTETEIENGDTVYDVLAEACKENGILFSANLGYIEGIGNVYEMDFGKNSGWIYFVNGEAPSVGCGNYELADGDEIEWHYTREMGKDLDVSFKKEYN